MLTIDTYVRPSSLEEAYQAAQRKNSVILGGMLWLRLGNRRISTAVDLSELGLDGVEDTGEAYRIGAYTSLRTLETHDGLNRLTQNAIRDSLRSIVGVQFRNLATVGGSVFGRFGFSDVVTTFLALGASVELYKAGNVRLEDFCAMGKVNDILTHVLLPKTPVCASYQAQRNSATDFPILNTCAALHEDQLTVAVGARPLRAVPYRFTIDRVASVADTAVSVADKIAEETVFTSNTRASEAYRRHLCKVLVRRAVSCVLAEQNLVGEEQ